MNPLMMLMAGAASHVTVKLSGGTLVANNVDADARIDLIIRQDGTVDKRENSVTITQLSAATDWIIPNGEAPDDYEVRYINATGDTADLNATSVEDTWYALSTSDWFIWVIDTTTALGGKSATFTVEIRKGSSGSAITSASYTLSADRDDGA